MRRLSALAFLAGLSLTLLGPQDASAQGRPQTREGFFLGFGVGYGSLGCSNCTGDREGGQAGHLMLGGALNDRMLLGAETTVWLKEQNGVTLTQGNVCATLYFYPDARSGFFLKGGVGFANLDLDVKGWGNSSETGFGVLAGLGYDVRVGRMFSLTPYGTFAFGAFDGGETNVVQAGVAVTWH